MNEIDRRLDPEAEELLEREQLLQERIREGRQRYSGLQDIDDTLELAAVQLRVALRVLESGSMAGDPEAAELVRTRVLAAAEALEELRRLEISRDQATFLTDAPGYEEVRELFQRFVLEGGGPLLEQRQEDARKLRVVGQAVAGALRKFAAPDDRYAQLFKTEELPPALRRLARLLLPVLAREHQQEPPFGIEEGEDVELRSERMTMPLSQAVYYLEQELLPQLERELEAEPGDRLLQQRRQVLLEKLREYKRITLRPRATPINLEKGFYTDWFTQYTLEGELLVTVDLPVRFLSGTNLDRLGELIRGEVVHRLAGKGVCTELDADYRYRKSLESGRRGSSREPSMKVDLLRGFQALTGVFPALRRLEDKGQLRELVELAQRRGGRGLQRTVEGLLADSRRAHPFIAPPEGSTPPEPSD